LNDEFGLASLTPAGRDGLCGPGAREEFSRHGFIVLPKALEPRFCHHIVESLRGAELIEVSKQARTDRTYFLTLNGSELLSRASSLRTLYPALGEVVSRIAGETLQPLDNAEIGVSLNYTPAGGQFVRHFDRNQFTVSMYLNDVRGGELNVWPNAVNSLLDRWGARGRSLAVRLTRLKKPIAISPRQGTLVLFDRRTVHSVRPVIGDRCRVSVIMAFDRPGVMFSREKEYYGFGTRRVRLDEVHAD